MIFTVTRASGLPLMLEPEEVIELGTLDVQGRWIELEDYEKQLREGDGLVSLMIEVHRVEELKIFLTTVDPNNTVTIDFNRMTIVIDDGGRDC